LSVQWPFFIIMNSIPPLLSLGDKVAVIATAKTFEQSTILSAFQYLKNWGLEVVAGQNLFKQNFQYAGTDAERLEDLQWAIDDPKIKAIFLARGGYGTGRIIDRVNFESLLTSPKWLIGFSDVTVLHFSLQKLGLQSIHGPMPITFNKNQLTQSLDKLKNILFNFPLSYTWKTQTKLNKTGNAKGELIGGNLSIINNLIGTKSDFDFSEKILFIEEVGEYLYHVDRMIVHLKRAEKLEKLNGLIVGHFSDIKDNPAPFGKNYQSIISDAVQEYNFPVAFEFPAGHEDKNDPLVLGAEINFEVKESSATINYSLYNTVRTV
jgi:muramoyltetrapeptide carboxypeptidase